MSTTEVNLRQQHGHGARTEIKLIDKLGEEEQKALFKMIDLAIANKRMKDNLKSIINE